MNAPQCGIAAFSVRFENSSTVLPSYTLISVNLIGRSVPAPNATARVRVVGMEREKNTRRKSGVDTSIHFLKKKMEKPSNRIFSFAC